MHAANCTKGRAFPVFYRLTPSGGRRPTPPCEQSITPHHNGMHKGPGVSASLPAPQRGSPSRAAVKSTLKRFCRRGRKGDERTDNGRRVQTRPDTATPFNTHPPGPPPTLQVSTSPAPPLGSRCSHKGAPTTADEGGRVGFLVRRLAGRTVTARPSWGHRGCVTQTLARSRRRDRRSEACAGRASRPSACCSLVRVGKKRGMRNASFLPFGGRGNLAKRDHRPPNSSVPATTSPSPGRVL